MREKGALSVVFHRVYERAQAGGERVGMGRGGRRRTQVQAEVHAALAEFAAAVEIRLHEELDRSRRTQVALVEAVNALRTDLTRRDKEFARALTAFGEALDHTADADRSRTARAGRAGGRGHRPHEVADRRCGCRRSSPRPPTPSGSSADASSDAPPPMWRSCSTRSSRTGTATARHRRNAPTNGNGNGNGNGDHTVNGDHVQCFLDGRWVDGFEVLDVVQDSEIVRYRLRRVSDGSVSRRLFDADEVRKAPADEHPTGSAATATRPEIYWTRS